jgi:hypothetical protein
MRIGPTFGAELIAAGCADGVVWDCESGEIQIDGVIGATGKVAAVLAAHDPTAECPAQPTIDDVIAILSPVQQTALQNTLASRITIKKEQ